jgi:3'(2'), 5'-bisphosphate nucleotidase
MKSAAQNAILLRSIQASIEAGYAILELYHSDFAVEKKADNTPLTLADKRSHEIIISYLAQFDIPILSEEGKDVPHEERKSWDRLWIVDPLDGTKEFVNRNGEFTVNIALVVKGRPVLGVIFVPERHTLYFAAQDLGTYKAEKSEVVGLLGEEQRGSKSPALLDSIVNCSTRLREKAVSGWKSPNTPLTIVGSRSHPTAELDAFIEEKRRQYGNIEFVSAGSSLKFCLIAEGMADIYPRLGPTMEWDTAAGQVIAENAGARVLRYDDGKPLTYNKESLLNPWFIVSAQHGLGRQ